MTLEEQIQADIMAAMKNKEPVRLNTLRGIKTAIMQVKTAPGYKGKMTDTDVIKIMQKLVKERTETAEIYSKAGRQELADKELAEAEVIKEYLPKQMDESEVENVVKEIISETNATSMKDMGKVMGIASKRLAGQADGKMISTIVKTLLA